MQVSHNAVTLSTPPSIWFGRPGSVRPGLIPVLSSATAKGLGVSAPYAAAGQHPHQSNKPRPGGRGIALGVTDGEADWNGPAHSQGTLDIIASQAEDTVIIPVRRGQQLGLTILDEPVPQMQHPDSGPGDT